MIIRNLKGKPEVRFEAPERNAVTELKLACNCVMNNLADFPNDELVVISKRLLPELEKLDSIFAAEESEKAKAKEQREAAKDDKQQDAAA